MMQAKQGTEVILEQLRSVFVHFPEIKVAFLFGSVAIGQARFSSDLDLGVAGDVPLTVEQHLTLSGALAETVHRPIDLIDFYQAGVVISRSVFRGIPVVMNDRALFGRLIVRFVTQVADFEPYRRQIINTRRWAWIGI